jgi:hypothetical protein
LAQAAALLARPTPIFELFTRLSEPAKLTEFRNLTLPSYWAKHYRFGKEAKSTVPKMGKTSVDLLLLNIASPMLAAYAQYIDNDDYIDKAIKLTELIKPEHNRIIKAWKRVGVIPQNGAESQGLIELYNENCLKNNCLNCGIGVSLLSAI